MVYFSIDKICSILRMFIMFREIFDGLTQYFLNSQTITDENKMVILIFLLFIKIEVVVLSYHNRLKLH